METTGTAWRLQGDYKGLQGTTGDYKGGRVCRDYRILQGDCRRLQETTGQLGQAGATRDYRRLQGGRGTCTGGWVENRRRSHAGRDKGVWTEYIRAHTYALLLALTLLFFLFSLFFPCSFPILASLFLFFFPFPHFFCRVTPTVIRFYDSR